MKITEIYSHLNGFEYIQYPPFLSFLSVLNRRDAACCAPTGVGNEH